MTFSRRFPHDFSESNLARELGELGELFDLTQSNPGRANLRPDLDKISRILGNAASASYQPAALGLWSAREAVAAYGQQMGRDWRSQEIALCASTSEAYSLLLKVFCNPGDSILVPAPGYPLLDHLATLESLNIIHYPLQYDGEWWLDLAPIREGLRAGARAILVVNPNNPTGQLIRPEEAVALARLARDFDVPLIVDEVFAPYGAKDSYLPSFADWVSRDFPLFILDGLSKAVGLPHFKLSWLVARGYQAEHPLWQHLEWVSDAFLSVASPVQLALSGILEDAPLFQKNVRARLAANHDFLKRAISSLPEAGLLEAQGGWYATIRLPQTLDDDRLVLEIAQRAGVLIHPGYFYGFHSSGYLILTLIAEIDAFQSAIQRLVSALQALLSEQP